MPKDTHRTRVADDSMLELPQAVTVAVAELAGAARQGLLALAVGTGLQVLRWVAAGMGEAAKQFRRVNGFLHLPALCALCAALERTVATAVTPAGYNKEDVA